MFSTTKSKLLLGVYVFLILSIPVGAYLVSQVQNLSSSAKDSKKGTIVQETPKKATPSAKQLLDLSEETVSKTDFSSKEEELPTQAKSFGPTLSLKVSLEGRPKNNQSTSLFIGIAEGGIKTNPKFLLSFTIDLPESGEYNNLSLAGLSPGSTYTALVKGSSQIATSSAFLMSPAITNLNEGKQINLLTGDLNDDNLINSADYSIAKNAYGATTKSSNWNQNIDFNRDGVINSLDLAFIVKNFGKSGESGAWVSPIPKSASSSGALAPEATISGKTPPIGSPDGRQGYWLWVPSN